MLTVSTAKVLIVLNLSASVLNLLAMDFFFPNFSTPCISNVSNTETNQGSIMK